MTMQQINSDVPPARVLVVEDDLVMQDLIQMILEHDGHRVFCAGNGQEGVALAREELPDVIFMDLMLPVLDGESAISILKEDPATRDIPIVAMSAGVNLRQHAAVSKADGMLAKPFDIDTLLAQVILRTRHPESQPAGD
jgi:CheY-like chemotaxis protein